jgi:branched-chain amino acid transport system substrate-binding protein
VIWGDGEPAEHKVFIANLRKAMNNQYGSGWAVMGYMAVVAISEGVEKTGSTESDKVSKGLLGLSFDTPVGKRTIDEKTHETLAGEFWSEMVKDPKSPSAVMKEPVYLDVQ